MKEQLQQLMASLKGELYFNDTAHHQGQLLAYSTDASVYEEKPLAVAMPMNEDDLVQLVHFATENKTTLIPRAAGTSLAGQVVGNGIVTDVSRYFNRIVQLNVSEQWVRVQTGVIRDDLNSYLHKYGLMFGPETSTANRAMIGGMVGNNSCGLHSIVWGSVRDHFLAARIILQDGSAATIDPHGIHAVDDRNGLLQKMEAELRAMLQKPANRKAIEENFPGKQVSRRNSGYALDALLAAEQTNGHAQVLDLCKLLAGSEGTLGILSEVTLRLLPLPPQFSALVCIHCASVKESLLANAIALQFRPMASELVDKCILDYTIDHPLYHSNRFFIEGDPAAILMVEFMYDSKEQLEQTIDEVVAALQQRKRGYAYPVLYGEDAKAAWDVRKSGLGLLRNSAGELQPVNLIEDCAVAPEDLPAYIEDLVMLLDKYKVQASFYAHAGAGELHVEPMINLKTAEGVLLFRNILHDTAHLVKKYKGSLSGEHGDGRLRGEFIAAVMGGEVMQLFRQVKNIFDPHGIFNAGKIVDTPPMDSHLRMQQDKPVPVIKTHLNFDNDGGIQKLAEKCSGSGDCRKSSITGGLMCPSYMATRNEFDTTRARANVLRQFLGNHADANPFDHQEIKEVMDLCLSCKGCKTECPSGVDITKMKAEFLQQYHDRHGIPIRSKMIGHFVQQMKLASLVPGLYNSIFSNKVLRKWANRLVGFHPLRSVPLLHKKTLRHWYADRPVPPQQANKTVYLFCDEFTDYLDVNTGKNAIQLLERLGYTVILPEHRESGRTFLSKGMVSKAAAVANHNISVLSRVVTPETPLIGVEPSALLTFRDEYKDLAIPSLKAAAKTLAASSFTIEEFLYKEMKRGYIVKNQFHEEHRSIVLHTHCYQKVLSSSAYSQFILGFPEHYHVTEIPSGCCGMAGSFGYEKEHYAVSQKVAGLVLYPHLLKLSSNDIIAAAGTSCRHQIKDGTGQHALHPVDILINALK